VGQLFILCFKLRWAKNMQIYRVSMYASC